MHLISKSSYVKGLQCPKALYLYKYHYNLMDETPGDVQKLFDTGHLVGNMAQNLFPGGVDCGMSITNSAEKSIDLTKKAIKEGAKVIYEAAFKYDDVLVLADIMIRNGGKWEIIEVKSSTSVKDYYYDDSSVQYYVISNCEIDIKDISIAYINTEYVKKGKIDIKKFFRIESLLNEAKSNQPQVKTKIAEFKKMLISKKMPKIDIGPHCSDPFDCEFSGHCWQHIPDYSVFNISRLGKRAFDLYEQGIIDIKDIPEHFRLSDKQIIERESYINGKDYINIPAINNYLKNIKYPLYFFDFETFMPAIPIWDGTRPYEMIPFQYSLYFRESANSEPEYFEYLGAGKKDPRQDLIEQFLENTKRDGTILAYNVAFEKARLTELSKAFPKYSKEIDKRIARLFDLMTPFANKYYYKPSMAGKYSIKSVLPAVNPKFDYSDLEIREGGTASSEFERMIYLNDEKEIANIRKNLLAYCKRDTFAMIVILEKLYEISE